MGKGHKGEYLFYVFDGKAGSPDPGPLPGNLELCTFFPSWKRYRIGHFARIWYYWFWYWFSRRKYRIYYVVDGDRVVHVSHVISRNPKFAFMGPRDMEIGPCWTHPEYRGRGIYPAVLARIAEDLAGRTERLFIFSERNNAASLKGITRSGFKFFGAGAKEGIWGVYRITSRERVDPSG